MNRDWVVLLALPLAAYVAPTYAEDFLSAAEALKVLLPAADRFQEFPLALTDAQLDKVRSLSGHSQRNAKPPVWRAEKSGRLLGWFIVDEVVGKHEFITYGTAISPDGHVIGIEIMSYRETHGGQIRGAEWRKTFEGKTLADPFKLNVDVPNISGATLSCRNVLDGVKRLLALHRVALSDG